MLYTVVIVTYNRISLLKECINAILSQTESFDRIIIVDNNSTDGTAEYLDSLSDSKDLINVFHMKKNMGGAGGFTKGIQIARKYKGYVLLIDDDAILDEHYLERMKAGFEDGISAYSGTVKVGGVIDTLHRRKVIDPVFLFEKKIPEKMYEKTSFYYDLSSFCGLMVSTDIIDRIGLPEWRYFIRFDDTEYCYRIREYTKIKNINDAVIDHRTKLQQFGVYDWKNYYGYRNHINSALRHSACVPAFKAAITVFYYGMSILYRIRGKRDKEQGSEYMKSAEMFMYVLKDGLSGKLGVRKQFLP